MPTDEVYQPTDPCDEPDPCDRALDAEHLRLAIMAAVHALPPRQRAVLLLRDVLSWRASEAADLLGTTEAGVNSALQRARAALETIDLENLADAIDAPARDLVARYLTAFAADDVDALVALATSPRSAIRPRSLGEPDSTPRASAARASSTTATNSARP